MKYLIRTRLAQDIICEVAFPDRQQGKIALVCGGAPGTPPNKMVLEFLASKGYVAFGIRYRGTWESEGSFLSHSPAKDTKDIIDYLVEKKGIVDAWSGEKIPLKIKYIDLFGGSFGGPAVLLNSKHNKVRKVIALAPVIDFRVSGEGETFEDFVRFSHSGFGDAYRVKNKSDWNKLLLTDFYNPITMLDHIDPQKCFVIQALDDDVCPPENVKKLLSQISIQTYFKPKGGHLGTSNIPQLFFWKKIDRFLHKK
jgi:pimeloyl-ACP methyl ester carboxylesterase